MALVLSITGIATVTTILYMVIENDLRATMRSNAMHEVLRAIEAGNVRAVTRDRTHYESLDEGSQRETYRFTLDRGGDLVLRVQPQFEYRSTCAEVWIPQGDCYLGIYHDDVLPPDLIVETILIPPPASSAKMRGTRLREDHSEIAEKIFTSLMPWMVSLRKANGEEDRQFLWR